MRKPDGTSVWNPAYINEEGQVVVDFSNQALAVPGRGYADITIQSFDGRISTASFIVLIQSIPNITDGIVSSNEFTQIQNILDNAEDTIRESEAWAVGTKSGDPVLGPSSITVSATAMEQIPPRYTVLVNESAFRERVGIHPGKSYDYLFLWDYSIQGWKLESKQVDLATYGISFIPNQPVISNTDTIKITVIDEDLTYDNNSKYWSDKSKIESQVWSIGIRGDEPIPPTDPAYNNYSKFWKAESEGWAVGRKNGNVVAPGEAQYKNNAKYWSDVLQNSDAIAHTVDTQSAHQIGEPTVDINFDSANDKYVFDFGIPRGLDGTYYSTFEVIQSTGRLVVNIPDRLENVTFNLNKDTGKLEVTIS